MNGDERTETTEAMQEYNIGRVLELLNQRLSKIENWIGQLETTCKQMMEQCHRR